MTIDDKVKKKKGKDIALRVLGGVGLVGVGVGIGYLLKQCPECEVCPEPPAAVVEEVDELEELEPTSPVVTEAPTEAPVDVDVRDLWLGNYEGTAEGMRETLIDGANDIFMLPDGELAWVEIMDQDDCFAYAYCNDKRTWGVDVNYISYGPNDTYSSIRIYIPDELSDASGMILTESLLTISPTHEHPYDVALELKDGEIVGYIFVNGVPTASGHAIKFWIIDHLAAEKSDQPDPALR